MSRNRTIHSCHGRHSVVGTMWLSDIQQHVINSLCQLLPLLGNQQLASLNRHCLHFEWKQRACVYMCNVPAHRQFQFLILAVDFYENNFLLITTYEHARVISKFLFVSMLIGRNALEKLQVRVKNGVIVISLLTSYKFI